MFTSSLYSKLGVTVLRVETYEKNPALSQTSMRLYLLVFNTLVKLSRLKRALG